MTQTGRRALVVHAIPGRLRIRFEEAGQLPASEGLAAVRVAPGVLSVEAKPAARSILVQYDPAGTTEALVIAELGRVGIQVVPSAEAAPSGPIVVPETASAGHARDAHGRFQRKGQAAEQPAASETEAADSMQTDSGGRSALMEMLIGPPPKLDRRFAESLALSAVSLLAARRVGLVLGGGMTLPAYFAIWFALRRMTGLGRRRV